MDSVELINASNNLVKFNPKSNFLPVESPVNTSKNEVLEILLNCSIKLLLIISSLLNLSPFFFYYAILLHLRLHRNICNL